jgi:hypothetical protein
MKFEITPSVKANVSVTLESIAKIRDIASLAADSRNPEHIGYVLQELYSILSTYIADELALFVTEDFEVDGTTLGIATVDCYMSPNMANRTDSVGVIAHEIGHQTGLAPWDLYGTPEMPGEFTLMGSRNPIHFSAYEKLHFGWFSPSVVDITAWTTRDLQIDAIETSKDAVIVYNPTRNNTEYFMVENRYKGPLGIFNYDRFLAPAEGPVLWHIVEDGAALDPLHPPPTADPAIWPQRLMQYGWVAGGIQNWGTLTPGRSVPLTWADGSSVGMTLTGVSTGSTAIVTFQKH